MTIKTNFLKNVVTLTMGTTVAQAIPIAVTPILTRIYTPEDFGLLALFVAITSILGSVANARYEMAIILPDSDDDAINIAAVGLSIAFLFSAISFIVIIFLHKEIVQFLGKEDIGFWLYFIPVVVFMTGLFNILNYLNTRGEMYKDIARANIFKSFTLSFFQLVLGVLKFSAVGLIFGQIISQFFANYQLGKNVSARYKLQQVGRAHIKKMARRYVDFPKYSMWGVLANSLSHNLINILISVYYAVTTLGFYNLAQRMLGLPASIIGASVGQVYFKEAARERKETGKAIKIYKKTIKKLSLIAFFIFGPLYFLLPIIFELVFGLHWRVAGEYGQIILPFVAIQFIAAALSNTNNIFEKQRIALIWQLGLLLISAAVFFLGNALGFDFRRFLITLSFVMSAHYLFLLAILKKVAEGDL